MIEPAVFLIVGIFGTCLVGELGRIGSTCFTSEKNSLIAGFSIAIGYVFAGGFRGIETSTDLGEVALAVGMAGGLALLWLRYFKREKAES